MSRAIYIAGPMRGYEQFNFPAFFAAEETIQTGEPDAVIFNPARRDHNQYGFKFYSESRDGNVEDAAAQYGFDIREALAADLTWICEHATAMHMLRGWSGSKGATAERALALALGIEITYEDFYEDQTEKEARCEATGFDIGFSEGYDLGFAEGCDAEEETA